MTPPAAGAGPASTRRLFTGSTLRFIPSSDRQPSRTRSPGSAKTTSSTAHVPARCTSARPVARSSTVPSAWRKRVRLSRPIPSDSSTPAGNHDSSAPVSTNAAYTTRRSPGRRGFSISTSTRKDPISADMVTTSYPPSSTLVTQAVSSRTQDDGYRPPVIGRPTTHDLYLSYAGSVKSDARRRLSATGHRSADDPRPTTDDPRPRLRPDYSRKSALRDRVARKHRAQIARAQVPDQDLAEEIAEVRRHRHVAPLVAGLHVEPRPAPRDPLAIHGSAQHQHRRGVPVVGAAGAVLADGPAELRHREHAHVAEPLAEIGRERGERSPQLVQPGGQLALVAALVHVGVPAAHVGERDLHAEVRLDQLGDLPHALAQPARRILGAVLG